MSRPEHSVSGNGPSAGSEAPIRILHISDLHFGRPFVPAVAEELVRVAPSLNPDAMVVSGDLTQRATRQQFVDARAYLDRFPDVPTLTVPGNHDIPLYRLRERLLSPRRLFREIITSDLAPVLEIDGAVLIGLDSTAPRMAISNGRLRKRQLDYCSKVFGRAAPEAARIVVTHHHLAQAPDSLKDRTIRGARRAIRRFVDMEVELVLGGHLHRGFISNSLDFFFGNHRDRGVTIVHCGTSTSRRGRGRERERNTFNLVEIERDRLTVTHFLYNERQGEFGPSSRHVFPRSRRRLTI